MANTQKKESSIAGSKSVILTSIICAVLLIGVIAWAVVTKSANSMRNQVAMTVGEHEISGVEFEYQYKESIMAFQQEYQDVLTYLGVDFESDLGSQKYTEEQTWKEYFIESAVNKITEQYLLINEAEKEGFELTAEEKDAALTELKNLKNMLSSLNLGFDSYIRTSYGKDINYSDMEDFSIKTTLAYNYLLKVLDSFEINDAEIDEYYNSHKDDLETVDFHSYQFAYTVPSDVEEGDESYKDEAKAKADAALEAVTDEDSIKDAIFAQLTAEEKEKIEATFRTYSEDIYKSAVNENIANWLFDESRVAGDKTVIEANGGFFVLYFVDKGLNDYETVNVRHILATVEDVGNVYKEDNSTIDEEATAAAKEKADSEAKAKAEEILNEWLAGDKTEESFAALATEHSEDSAEGGLYTQVTKGYMVAEFNDWIFDESRKVGDYDIIKTDYGYHIMYFSGTDEIAWKLEAKNSIETEKYAEYKADLETKYEVVTYDDVMNRVG